MIMWPINPRWPPDNKIDLNSHIFHYRRIILVSSPMFSGSRNSMNIIKILYNDHVTVKFKISAQNGTEWPPKKEKNPLYFLIIHPARILLVCNPVFLRIKELKNALKILSMITWWLNRRGRPIDPKWPTKWAKMAAK